VCSVICVHGYFDQIPLRIDNYNMHRGTRAACYWILKGEAMGWGDNDEVNSTTGPSLFNIISEPVSLSLVNTINNSETSSLQISTISGEHTIVIEPSKKALSCSDLFASAPMNKQDAVFKGLSTIYFKQVILPLPPH